VGDEAGAEELRIGVDEVVELRQDGKPDVVWADDQRMVLIVCKNRCLDETVVRWDGVANLRGRRSGIDALLVLELGGQELLPSIPSADISVD
jgi:hypothetical protein